jgi:hypothetical protein
MPFPTGSSTTLPSVTDQALSLCKLVMGCNRNRFGGNCQAEAEYLAASDAELPSVLLNA